MAFSILVASCGGEADKTNTEKPIATVDTAKSVATSPAMEKKDTPAAVVAAPPPKPENFDFDQVKPTLDPQVDAVSQEAAKWLKKSFTTPDWDDSKITNTRVFTPRCLEYYKAQPDDIEYGLMSERELKKWKSNFTGKWGRDFDLKRRPGLLYGGHNGGCARLNAEKVRFLGSQTDGYYYSISISCDAFSEESGKFYNSDGINSDYIVRVIEKDGGFRVDNIMSAEKN